MKKKFLLAFSIAITLLTSVTVYSQIKIVDNIKPSNFHGVYEMKGYGYFLCYKHENKDVIELYDYNLNPVRRVPLNLNIKDYSFMHGTSNGSIFLLTYIDIEKSKKWIIAFDSKLNNIGELVPKDYLLNVFHIDNESFGVLTSKGGLNTLKVYDNTLKEVKSTVFAEGYSLGASSLEGSAVSGGAAGANMFPAPNFKGFSEDNDYLVLLGSKVKGFKAISNKLFVLDKKGNLVFDYDFPLDQYLPFYVYEQAGNIYALVWEGKFGGKIKERKMTGFSTIVIDKNGKLKEKIVNEMPISDFLTPLDYVKGPNGIMLTCMSMSAPDNKIMINAYTVDFHFMFLHFDNSGKLVSAQNVTKKMGSSDTPLMSNYCHTGATADGKRVYTIYFTRDKKKLMFHAAFSDQQGVSPIEDEEIYEDDLESESEKISINWFNVFPAEPGMVAISFYSSKKKSMIMYKLDVSQFGSKGNSPIKKN